MKKSLLILALLFINQTINAQYTDIINSKRPGLSESPYGVGTDVLQIEGGIFYGEGQSDATFVRIPQIGGTLLVRYGKFIENLEVNVNASYQKDEHQFKNVLTSSRDLIGISKLTVGLKYLIFQQKYTDKSKEIRSWKRRMAFDRKRLIPSVGIYVGYHLDNFLNEDFKDGKMSPKAAILLQNNFSNSLNLIANIIADKIGTDYSVYSYIATMTLATSQQWSFFIESQGDFYENKTDFQIGGGIAFLYTPNLQFDLSIRTNTNTVETSFIAGLGASWRLDRHQDSRIEKGENSKRKRKKGNFFSRLFKKNN